MRMLNILIISIGLIITGCGPRGESRSLDEILASAKSEYHAQIASVTPEIKPDIDRLTRGLERSLAGVDVASDVRADFSEVEGAMMNLIGKAGYTSRPALGELMSQFRSIANGENSYSKEQVVLLVARTYFLLSTELKTAKFGII